MKVMVAAPAPLAMTSVFVAKAAPVFPFVPEAVDRILQEPRVAVLLPVGYRNLICGSPPALRRSRKCRLVPPTVTVSASSDRPVDGYHVGGSSGAGPRRGSRQRLGGLGGEVDRASE